ncbi:MAG: repeat-containing protein [Massilia sp.]|jgi:TPR repeat protein|nr:repeat-containing protein [Massilia sp.]
MSYGYNLACTAYHRYYLDDEKVTRKVLLELNAADHAHASLVEAIIRWKHQRQFKEPEAVLAAFSKAGKLGLAFGHFCAADLYTWGYGVRKNRRTAARRYREAADKGSISAMLALGTMYSLGDGVAADSSLALKLFEQAASARVPYIDRATRGTHRTVLDSVHLAECDAQTRAMEQLGVMYRDGTNGVSPCNVSAHRWFRRAAENGSASAKSCLKKLPPAPPPPPFRPRPRSWYQPVVWDGVPIKDEGKKLHGMDSAAAYLQGKMYSGASQPNYKLAARHFEIAAQLGHRDANTALKEVKAAVGERAFSLFFAGWSAMEPP